MTHTLGNIKTYGLLQPPSSLCYGAWIKYLSTEYDSLNGEIWYSIYWIFGGFKHAS
jgi:hypothetical protein